MPVINARLATGCYIAELSRERSSGYLEMIRDVHGPGNAALTAHSISFVAPMRMVERIICGAAAAGAFACLVPALLDARVPPWERGLLTVFVLLAALTSRSAALMLLAAVPLGFLAPPASGSPVRLTEALVAAAIGGWSARAAVRATRRPLPPPLWTASVLTATVLACSVFLGLAWNIAETPQTVRQAVGETLRGNYFLDRGAFGPTGIAVVQLEALGLFMAVAALAIEAPSFVASFARILVAGAAAAAALNLQRFVEIVERAGGSMEVIRHTLRAVRINIGYADVNAAGSFFALAGTASARLSIVRSRVAIAVAGIATAVIVAAMWLTGSRAAVAAFLLGCLGLLASAPPSRHRRRLLAIGIASCAATIVLFVALFPNRITGSGTSFGLLTRIEMGKVALRMTTDHPWFGVGVGHFWQVSADYLPSTRLAGIYSHENAHNNYLQVLAELGIIGAAAVLWLLVVACRHALRDLGSASASRIALLGGLAAFGLTMLFGHPLLTPEACYTFALAAGVATGAGIRDASSTESTRTQTAVIAAAIALLAVTLPIRIHAARAGANMEHIGWGTGPWIVADDGVKARAVLGNVTLFVPTRATVVEIPFRLARTGEPVTFTVGYRGHTADPLVVSSTSWSQYRLIVGSANSDAKFEPLTLTPSSGDGGNVLLGKMVEY
jgi:O-antigen ligase